MTPYEPNDVSTDDRLMIDYLLGRLPPLERERLEERFFADDAFADRLLEHEDDLLDELAAGTLNSPDERALLDRQMSTPEGARRAVFARALHEWRVRHPPVAEPRDSTTGARPSRAFSGPLPAWLATAAAVMLAAGAGWLAMDNARLRGRLDAPPTPHSATEPVQRATGSSASEPRTVAVTLSGERVRSSSTPPVVELTSGDVVHFSLVVSEAADAFDATVETSPGGQLVTRHVGLRKSAAGTVDLWVGGSQLPTGSYEVLLSADRGGRAELIAQYAYRIVRRNASDSP